MASQVLHQLIIKAVSLLNLEARRSLGKSFDRWSRLAVYPHRIVNDTSILLHLDRHSRQDAPHCSLPLEMAYNSRPNYGIACIAIGSKANRIFPIFWPCPVARDEPNQKKVIW